MAVDIPNYRVIEKLGVGAETRVFRARCMRTGRDYTIKLVKIVKPEDAAFIELLKAEYAIGSVINHPVVRKVYELRMLRQRLRVRGAILFLEFVDGISLSDKDFRQPVAEVLRVFEEAAAGLYAIHQAGYVHADLKPNNIMVTRDGQVKVIDLGQSTRLGGAKTRIQGTIDFIAPEQVQRGVLDERTDVFGLGAALHRVLTGRPVQTDMNRTVTVHSQSLIGKRVNDVRSNGNGNGHAELPVCISRLIAECCQYSPADRIPNMVALGERLALARAIVSRPEREAAGTADDFIGGDGDLDDDAFDRDGFDESSGIWDDVDAGSTER